MSVGDNNPHPRGLTSLELIIALTITALIAAAMSGMLQAVGDGISTRIDTRSIMVRANSAQTRLNAYIGPSRALLDTNGQDLVLWLHDLRQSGTVHASEIRWLKYDPAGAIDVYFVDFPNAWSEIDIALEDNEYPKTSDWDTVFNDLDAASLLNSLRLVDGLTDATVTIDAGAAIDGRHVIYILDFLTQSQSGSVSTQVSATIQAHQPPVS